MNPNTIFLIPIIFFWSLNNNFFDPNNIFFDPSPFWDVYGFTVQNMTICRSCVSEIKFVDKEHLRVSSAWNVRCSWRISVWFRASAKLCSNNWPWPQKLRCRTELLWKTDQKAIESPWTTEIHRISTEFLMSLDVFGNFGLSSGNDHEWSILLRREAPVLSQRCRSI